MLHYFVRFPNKPTGRTIDSIFYSPEFQTYVQSEEEKEAKIKAIAAYKESSDFLLNELNTLEEQIKENKELCGKFAALQERIKNEPAYRKRFHPKVVEHILLLDLDK